MRRTILVLATLSGITLTTACAGQPQQVSGEAKPVGAAAPVTAPATTPAASSSPSAVPTSPSPAKTSDKPKSSTPVFGPTGVGKLKIGMSVKSAKATGEMGSTGDQGAFSKGCGVSVVSAAKPKDVRIIHSSARGLVYIPAWGRVATPEGIRIGSTYEKVKAAYPDFQFRIVEEDFVFKGAGDAFTGRQDEHANVHYRFRFKDNKVAEMALEHDNQDCYE